MASRPTFIELPQARDGGRMPGSASRNGMPSPRIQHYAGDVPPALSPLDAFAAQSRKMALDLENKSSGQNRLSRLPPALVTKSLTQHRAGRPQCFRSLSQENDDNPAGFEFRSPISPQISHPIARPMSSYPHVRNVSDNEDEELSYEEVFKKEMTPRPETPNSDFFTNPQVASPERASIYSLPEIDQEITPSTTSAAAECAEPGLDRHRTATAGSTNSQPDLIFTLVPPNPLARFTNQLKSLESSDDDYQSSITGSTFSHPRKFSSSSGVSTPHSPLTGFALAQPRSPSATSVRSVNGSGKSRSHLNFSRPMSSTSLTRGDSPIRQQSTDTQQSASSLHVAEALPPRPSFDSTTSEISEGYVTGQGSSYTYGKYSLPRGRMLSRNSAIFQGLSTPHFEWNEPLFQNSPTQSEHPVTPPKRSSDEGTHLTSQTDPGRPSDVSGFSFEFDRPKDPPCPTSTTTGTSPAQSFKSAYSSPDKIRRATETTSPPNAIPHNNLNAYDEQSVSTQSQRTVRPRSVETQMTNYQSMTSDDHLNKAIELHNHGDLKESTYHLRLAAMQDHPTAMLLYALACRHGWGMRTNPREGVQWLRRAVDAASQEMANDEDPRSGKTRRDYHERQSRRAQFALSIYELGISHLRGWGVEKDQSLALRCFEIAGSWGDADALTEAGFCYAEGIGCKKDLRKAAKFYRQAEAGGINMVGNSW